MVPFLSSVATAKNTPLNAVTRERAVEIAAHAATSEGLDVALYKNVSTMGPYGFDQFAQQHLRTGGRTHRHILSDLRGDLLGHRFWLVNMTIPAFEGDPDAGEIIAMGGGGYWAFVDSSTGKVLRSIVWK